MQKEEPIPIPVYQVFFVNVDNLRVRQAPNLESTVLDKIREGTLVYSKNEFSDKQETITLRGKKTTSPYYFVTGDGFKEGWVYGGALVKIYQNSSPSPFTSRIQEFIAGLKILNYSEMETGSKIFSKIREYKGSDPVWNDAIYVIAKHFFDQLPQVFAFNQEQRYAFSDADYRSIIEGKYDMTGSLVTANLDQNGYKLEATEGDIYAVKNDSKLQKIIRGPFSEPMRSHLDLKEKFENTRISEDATLIIDLKEVVDMAIAEESFVQQNPNFIYIEEREGKKASLQYILTNGMDNTPLKMYQTNQTNPIFLQAWEYARRKYPESDLVRLLDQKNLDG